MRVQNLAFIACSDDRIQQVVAALQALDGERSWELIFFRQPPAELPPGFQMRRAESPIRTALALYRSSRTSPYQRIVIVCGDREALERDQLLVGFASKLGAHSHLIVELLGSGEAHTSVGSRRALSSAMLVALLGRVSRPLRLMMRQTQIRWGRAAASGITKVGLAIWWRDSVDESPRATGGRVAIVVPILPDLSHTFVYREVIELTRRHPDYLIVALERGDPAILHPEARMLADAAQWVPMMTEGSYIAFYIRCWLRRPRAMATLVRSLSRHSASFCPGASPGNTNVLLDSKFCGHVNHPSSGLLLAALLRTLGVAHVHAYGSTYPSLRVMVARQAIGISYSVSTFVDFDYQVPFRMLEEKFGPARFVVGCTGFCGRRLAERIPQLVGRLRVLHHSIPRNYAKDARLRVADGRSRLIFVGRMVPKKGLLMLIDICALLRQRQVAFTAHIYGAGPQADELARAVQARELRGVVHLEPPVPNDSFLNLMNHDDVFVCTSREMPDGERDGIPVTLIEAMSAGITVTATAISGIPELIEHGRNGYLVPPNDPVACADLLERLLTNPAARDRVRREAMETVARQFTTEVLIDALEQWISQETGLAGGTLSQERSHAGDSA